MQIKVYSIPIHGGERLVEEMNVFLRSKKVLQIEQHIVTLSQSSSWCFCIHYIDDVTITESKVKIDYREALDDKTFKVFSRLREIRKKIATEEGLPAYAIFTDEELSNIAKLEEITASKMQTIKGIGEKKVEKYAQRFIAALEVGSTSFSS